MSKTHYETIVKLLRETKQSFCKPGERNAIRRVTIGLCEIFEQDNKRFDRSRFIYAVEKED